MSHWQSRASTVTIVPLGESISSSFGGFRSPWAPTCSPAFDPPSALRHDAVPMRIRLFAPSCAGHPRFNRIEQLP
jgi:hypothetical protein